jgi:hypothetical protein
MITTTTPYGLDIVTEIDNGNPVSPFSHWLKSTVTNNNKVIFEMKYPITKWETESAELAEGVHKLALSDFLKRAVDKNLNEPI